MIDTSVETIPLDDRGLAYGDGVFETILVQHGKPSLWAWHCARLMRGCRQLGFKPPTQAELDAQCCALPSSGCHVLKLIVTRGSGGRGYNPPVVPTPRLLRRLMPFSPQPVCWQQGVNVRVCTMTLANQPRLAGIKHLNRLENVLARQEWQDTDIAEGLLCNERHELIEATAMNIVWYDNNQWLTSRTDECGVMGTLTAALLKAGQLTFGTLALDALPAVRHLCVLNSVQGVWPVRQVINAQGSMLSSYDIDGIAVHDIQQQAHALLGYSNDTVFKH